MSDRNKFKIGVRNCKLGAASRLFSLCEETDAVQLVKSICCIVSEQKANAWNSWCSIGLC